MKTTIFALAAAGLVAAQDFAGQPECAVDCLREAIPKAGCDLDDTACQCSEETQSKLLGLVAPCLTEACSPTELLAAQRAAAAACEAFAASATGSSSASASSASAASTGSDSVSTTVTETATETATESDDDTTLATGFTLSGLETVTGTVTLPAIFSSVSEIDTVVPPVTPGHNSSITTRTRTVGTDSDGATTIDGGSDGGSGGDGTATGTSPPVSTETDSGASLTGPVFGLMAMFAAALAL